MYAVTAAASASTGSGRTHVRRLMRCSSAINPSRVDCSDWYQSSPRSEEARDISI